MKKLVLFSLTCIIAITTASAQKVYTKNGNISFFSKTIMENISADNSQVMSVLDKNTGDLQFSVLIRSFHFKKALMEEHFNENYMESDKFPKALFKGQVDDLKNIDFTKDGVYKIKVKGQMTLHGVTDDVKTEGNITVKSGMVTGSAMFKIKLEDYKISVPSVVKNNISEVIDITVNCVYDQKL
ncbi:MAG: YceI family protein [Ferruginibacter sp.]